MKAWTVLGVAVDGEWVCTDCTQTTAERKAFTEAVDDITPLFASDSDGTEVCGRCQKLLTETC